MLRRMDIESVVVGGGPVASLVVLRAREPRDGERSLQLPIRIGSVEATAITMGVRERQGGRPMTHDLFCSAISALGGRVDSVRVTAVQGTTFFAQVDLTRADGERVSLDARPSDAIALAVRLEVPVFADDEVLRTAAMPDFNGVERDEKAHELQEFHEFVESLSPEDFNVTHGDQDGE
ncbi:bifunctional nuclease family protein [Thermophilibacter sp.]